VIVFLLYKGHLLYMITYSSLTVVVRRFLSFFLWCIRLHHHFSGNLLFAALLLFSMSPPASVRAFHLLGSPGRLLGGSYGGLIPRKMNGVKTGIKSLTTTMAPDIKDNWRFGRGRMVLNMGPNDAVRVRFAPSPTGSLHVGGARTALFNWLLARKTKGAFLVRVEDTDEARSTRESEESILNDLTWLNLNWDEGPNIGGPHAPYRQSERKDIYQKYAQQLVAGGHAYPCFCSEGELEEKKKFVEDRGGIFRYDGTWRNADADEVKKRLDRGDPHTIRFKVPNGKIVVFDDVVRGRITWEPESLLGDFILLRSNGMPVYNYCVAVDDATMKITHVVRAEEHLSNTLRQLLVLEALNYKPPIYAHCSLILGPDKSKLSKRHGATSVNQFKLDGFHPDAMVNYLANLGWNDGTDKEIYTPEELIKAFDLNRIVKSAAVFDIVKLKWMNGQHLRLQPPNVIQDLVRRELYGGNHPLVLNSSLAGDDRAQGVSLKAIEERFLPLAAKIAQRDMELLAESTSIVLRCLQYQLEWTLKTDAHVNELLTEEIALIQRALVRDWMSGAFPVVDETDQSKQLNTFAARWKAYTKGLARELGLNGKSFFHPLRLLLTGRVSGPDVGDILQLTYLAFGAGLPNGRIINSHYEIHDMASRFESISAFSLVHAKEVAPRNMTKIE
jgi:glutamyl-tRNA synthetase